MTTNPRPAFRLPRAAFLGLLLVLALGVAGVLAYEACQAAASHEAVAAGILRDYVQTATWEYARGASKGIESGVLQAIKWLPWPAASRPPALLDPILGAFEIDLATRRVLSTTVDLPARVLERLVDGAQAPPRNGVLKGSEASLAVVDGPGARRVFGFVVKHSEEEGFDLLVGFETTPDALARVLRVVHDRQPLLPPSLMRGAPNAAVLAVRVAPVFGPTVFESSAVESRFRATERFDDRLGGLVATGSLQPDAASRLIVGGLPRSRLPLVIGLLAVTVLLIVAALLQLRREYELARLRTEFVSCVSHELRTPLAQIRMFGEMLLLGRARSDAEHRRALEIIDQEARRLTHLIENVLLFSRSERRVTRVVCSLAPVAPTVRAVVEAFAPLARARRVKVTTSIEHDALMARYDQAALRQILLNLLDNAVKYGPPGQRVLVGLARAGDRARLWVEDQGPGVPPADCPRIWEPFYRASRERASSVAGTGIGLAVVRELCTLHGGSATVESVEGGGARFVVELPGAEMTDEGSPEPAPSAVGSLS